MYIYKVKLFYWINKFCLKLKTLRFVFFDISFVQICTEISQEEATKPNPRRDVRA